MKRLLAALAPFCCIYDINFRNLVEEHAVVAGEDINGKVDLQLMDLLYNLRNDRDADSLEYNYFACDNIRSKTIC